MPTIIKRVALAVAGAAGSSVDNILAGSQYEFAPFDGTIEVGIIANRANTHCAVFSGPDVLAEPGSVCPTAATLGTEATPKYPDDFFLEDDVAQGDRLKVSLLNNDVAISIVNVALRITPA
jgi:hypothetical protein